MIILNSVCPCTLLHSWDNGLGIIRQDSCIFVRLTFAFQNLLIIMIINHFRVVLIMIVQCTKKALPSNHVDEINLLYQEAKVILTFLDVLSSSSDVGQLQDSFQLAF